MDWKFSFGDKVVHKLGYFKVPGSKYARQTHATVIKRYWFFGKRYVLEHLDGFNYAERYHVAEKYLNRYISPAEEKELERILKRA